MPISSGAGGKAARLHLMGNSNHSTNSGAAGNSKSPRSYWPNATAAKSSSASVLHAARPIAGGHQVSSSSAVNLPSEISSFASTRQSKPSASVHRAPLGARKHKQQTRGPPEARPGRASELEKYKQIGHISPPSSHATTSQAAAKYFTATGEGVAAGNEHSRQSGSPSRGGAGREIVDAKQQQQELEQQQQQQQQQQEQQRVKKSNKTKRHKAMTLTSSLGGQLVLTGGQHELAPARDEPNANERRAGHDEPGAGSRGLFSSLMVLGGAAGQKAAPPPPRHQHYLTINQHNSQSSLLNPSVSLAGSAGQTTAAASTANLHSSLASLAAGVQSGGARSARATTASANVHAHAHANANSGATTTISKRINLKYVKTLILLLMSLDLAVTLFVQQLASNDEFSLIFTQHKLRFSLVNLVLSAIWFVTLAAAILFDIYAILLMGALVDLASFVLLLVCSVIHFTHRIDYNTVNLTSLLLLLFAIIVLHVYLVVIAALMVYLMMAVKRRRRKH